MRSYFRFTLVPILIGGFALLYLTFSGGLTQRWPVAAQAQDAGPAPMIRFGADTQAIRPSQYGPAQTESDNSSSKPKVADKATAYFNRGTAYYQKGNFESAIKFLSMSLAIEPNWPNTYFNRGLSYRRWHKNDEAILDFTRAIQLYPAQPKYYLERCNALIVKNNLSGAIADCSEALRLSPYEASGYLMRGVAHLFNGDIDEALADSIQAIEIEPDYSDAIQLLYETLVRREMMANMGKTPETGPD